MRRAGPRAQQEDYAQAIKPLGSPFSSVESFWAAYSWMSRPLQMPNSSEFHLFKADVKPMWEDPANQGGGKFVVRVRKVIAHPLSCDDNTHKGVAKQ
jgi:translation initiation factor 4E